MKTNGWVSFVDVVVVGRHQSRHTEMQLTFYFFLPFYDPLTSRAHLTHLLLDVMHLFIDASSLVPTPAGDIVAAFCSFAHFVATKLISKMH